MEKIINPFSKQSDPAYHCFGCDPGHPFGLKLEFIDNGEELLAYWTPSLLFEGYTDVVHGGILATLADETASWFVYTKCRTAGVTSSLKVRYLKPVRTSAGRVTVKTTLVSREKTRALMECIILDGAGVRCAEAEMDFFLFPEEIARKRFHYPGVRAFYEE